jgi:hypothetical protein
MSLLFLLAPNKERRDSQSYESPTREAGLSRHATAQQGSAIGVVVTQGIFSGDALKKLEKSRIKSTYVTNSIEHS